jgi:ligand-binding sensor domain-containing protein
MTVHEGAVHFLLEAELEVEGRLVDASNASFLLNLSRGNERGRAIYKPIAGERPLWDFPDGNLAQREVAAFYLSSLTTWDLVPPTVLRDGPVGIGSLQLWIETNEELEITQRATASTLEMQRFAIFDAFINNTDRKFGHLLLDVNGKMWGCDHGVCFHEEDKLRTVIWQFAGDEIPAELIEDLEKLSSQIDQDYLLTLISENEIRALRARIELLLTTKKFPLPNPEWPAIPWPPF